MMNKYRLMFEWMVFINVVDSGGLSKAANKLNCSVSLISKCISKLECNFNTQLIIRNAHDFEVTNVGKVAYSKALELQGVFNSLATEVSNTASTGGVIKVCAPSVICDSILNEWLFSFSKENPGVSVHLKSRESGTLRDDSPEFDDIVIKSGFLNKSDLIHKKIHPVPFGVYASPEYVSRNKDINGPEDLLRHPIIKLEHSITTGEIKFAQGSRVEMISIDEKVFFSSNSIGGILSLAAKGYGVCVAVPDWVAAPYIDSGKLVRVLPAWEFPRLTAYLVWRYRQNYSFYFRKIIDFIECEWNAFFSI